MINVGRKISVKEKIKNYMDSDRPLDKITGVVLVTIIIPIVIPVLLILIWTPLAIIYGAVLVVFFLYDAVS